MLQASSKHVWVTFQKEGIHCFPAAADLLEYADVRFLSYPHRHIFHFKVLIQVFHDDRDIEFILFKRFLESLYSEGTLTLHNKSCEMIADELAEKIDAKYPGRDIAITVSEDNENGAFCTYNHRPDPLEDAEFKVLLHEVGADQPTGLKKDD